MRKAIFALTAAGAVLLIVSQFLPLYHVHVPTSTASFGSATVGSDHAYSVLLLGLLALFLGASVRLSGNRFALLLIGLLGIVALAIGLGHDLSDARAHGLKLIASHYTTATNVLSVGLYVEIAGALLLMIATVGGFLFGAEVLETVRPTPRTPTTREGRRKDSSDRPITGTRRSETHK